MYDYFVTGEDYYGGMMAAQMLVDALNGEGEIVILEGMHGSSTAAAIHDGVMKIFGANPGIKIATSETANWARSEGYDVTTNILAAHPTINGLIAANDEMAQGAIQAIAAAGLTDQITVVTLNYTQDCIDTMKSGQLYGTVDKGPYRQGYQAIARLRDFFNGVTFDRDETVPPIAYLATDPETPNDKYDVKNFK
jgi:ribose transport system substrate-binding protein